MKATPLDSRDFVGYMTLKEPFERNKYLPNLIMITFEQMRKVKKGLQPGIYLDANDICMGLNRTLSLFQSRTHLAT